MILGIDTASVAGNKSIDWTAAKAAGLSFAIIRSNYGDGQDTVFAREWDRIRAATLVRGAYLFLRYPRDGKKVSEPERQAKAMINAIGPIQPGDLPPTVDLEFPGGGRAETGMTVAECLTWILRARGILKNEYGVDPIIYTSARVWRDDLGNSKSDALADCPLWLARYPFKKGTAVRSGAAFEGIAAPPVPPPWGDADNWWIHQYQGDATGFPGFLPVTSNVDMNRFNPLYKGSGARVRWVQRRLQIDPTGKMDIPTKAALMEFQAKRGLVADAIVGPRTFAYLAWQVV
jgi:GH25 family lysozyme M1 (1,4-beta-N-acetylmuramidase)